MLDVYIILVKHGIRTLDSIPEEFREDVRKALEDASTDSTEEVTE